MYKITNKNEFTFTGRFDGKDYRFPAGKTVSCPDDAAAHIFGVGQQDKTAVLSRNGWATFSGSLAEGMAVLNKFQFEGVEVKLDAPLALVNESGPAPGPEGAGADDASPDSGADLAPVTDSPRRGPGRPPNSSRVAA